MRLIFLTIVQMSITASFVILVVLLLRFLLKRTPKIFSYALWAIVLFRLVCPVALEGSFGLPQSLNSILFMIPSAQNTLNNFNGTFEFEKSLQTIQEFGGVSNIGDGAVTTVDSKQDNAVEKEAAMVPNGEFARRLFLIGYNVWLIGMAVLLLYSGVAYFSLKRKLSGAMHVEEKVYELANLSTPFVFGLFRPRIFLPTGIEGEEREYILAHEKMHIRRFDHVIKPIGFLVLILHWMNPLVWVAFLCMTKDMEMSCDEAVIKSFGEGIKKDYSVSLLHMAMHKSGLSFVPLAFGEENVKSRIKNVLHYKKTGIGILAVCICVLIGAVVILTTNQPAPENQENSSNEELSENMDENSFEEAADSEVKNPTDYQEQVEKWAQAFCDRDGDVILSMLSEEAIGQLQERGLLDVAGGTASFGVSSPWPMQPEDSYLIQNVNISENTAEILYYAITSDPHILVWKEKIVFTYESDEFVITSEELNYLDSIATEEEYQDAYPDGIISGTQMDYSINGLGEMLNNNALLSSSNAYIDLFSPDTAAIFLLNLSDNQDEVETAYGYLDDGTDDVFVHITFGSTEPPITVKMIQPYRQNGIWIPQNMESEAGRISHAETTSGGR